MRAAVGSVHIRTLYAFRAESVVTRILVCCHANIVSLAVGKRRHLKFASRFIAE